MAAPRASHGSVPSVRSRSLPDTSQLEKMTQFFLGPSGPDCCGRSCSLQDASLLREAYSSSECDSTSSSSSSSESLTTSTSSSGSGSDSTSTDDDDEELDNDDYEGAASADLFVPRAANRSTRQRTLTAPAVATATSGCSGGRPLSALPEQRESTSSASTSADFASSPSSADEDADADDAASPPDAFADEGRRSTAPPIAVASSCPLRLQQWLA